MERVFTEGVIYKLIKYTDKSAIAFAYSYDFGKMKLFMPKAFSAKGGIITLVPGEIDCLKKSSSDLNKLYAFRQFPEYMQYVENPEISLRLNLLFDFLDNLYETDQKEPVIWTLIKKFKESKPSKVLVFAIYAMLKNSGQMFIYGNCCSCHDEITENAALHNGQYFCPNCSPENAITTDFDVNLILRSLGKSHLYKNITINVYQELKILEVFIKHTENVTGKKLKSYQTFKELLKSL